MPKFRVQRYDGPTPIGKPELISADNEQQAAEKVCNEILSPGGKAGQLRAVVSPASNPGAKKSFFSLPAPLPT